jgi:hypothetical protein
LGDLLQRIALGRTDAHKLMRGRGRMRKHAEPPRVQFDSDACATATLVEIDAEDRPGLLYSLATVFSASACNIDIVLVDTKGHRAIDVFYVAHDGPEAAAGNAGSAEGKAAGGVLTSGTLPLGMSPKIAKLLERRVIERLRQLYLSCVFHYLTSFTYRCLRRQTLRAFLRPHFMLSCTLLLPGIAP